MATLLAHITIHPGKEAEFERVSRAMYNSTHGTEANVRRYEYWRGEAEGTYYCLQSFDDANGFIHHQVSPHHEGFGPDFAALIKAIRLEWVDPLVDAAPLAPSRAQELPADATDAMRAYAQRQGLKVQPWWERLRGF